MYSDGKNTNKTVHHMYVHTIKQQSTKSVTVYHTKTRNYCRSMETVILPTRNADYITLAPPGPEPAPASRIRCQRQASTITIISVSPIELLHNQNALSVPLRLYHIVISISQSITPPPSPPPSPLADGTKHNVCHRKYFVCGINKP